MGADIILADVRVRHKITHSDKDKPFWDKLRKAYLDKAKKFTQKDFDALEAEEGYSFDRDKVNELIDTMIDCLADNSRETTWIREGGVTIYITGGMSWGDDPTEDFRTFDNFTKLFPYEYVDDVLKDSKPTGKSKKYFSIQIGE